jgi:L-threonylcarbamoyladenylate synthase
MMERHYSPHAELELVENDGQARAAELLAEGNRVGWIPLGTEAERSGADLFVRPLPLDSAAYAARMYAALYELDANDVARIVVQIPPDTEEWLAVRDRLYRASERSGE